MSQKNILTLAKQGDENAIAALIAYDARSSPYSPYIGH
jgi:hypothetical protein